MKGRHAVVVLVAALCAMNLFGFYRRLGQTTPAAQALPEYRLVRPPRFAFELPEVVPPVFDLRPQRSRPSAVTAPADASPLSQLKMAEGTLKVLGIFSGPGGTFAVLQWQPSGKKGSKGEAIKVKTGDRVAGLRVHSIGGGRVSLADERGDRVVTLRIFHREEGRGKSREELTRKD